jgi:hypothetical protein
LLGLKLGHGWDPTACLSGVPELCHTLLNELKSSTRGIQQRASRASPSHAAVVLYGVTPLKVCRPVTECGPGSVCTGSGDTLQCSTYPRFEAIAPLPTADRVCGNVTLCGAGESQHTAPTFTTDRVCECVPGEFYLDASTAECVECSACVPHTSTVGGQYEVQGCLATVRCSSLPCSQAPPSTHWCKAAWQRYGVLPSLAAKPP